MGNFVAIEIIDYQLFRKPLTGDGALFRAFLERQIGRWPPVNVHDMFSTTGPCDGDCASISSAGGILVFRGVRRMRNILDSVSV